MIALDEQRMHLLDNNVLAKLTVAQRASAAFQRSCRIPEEVLWEASGLPDASALERCTYPTSPVVLHALVEVMSTISPSDRTLVDLYANQGAGDPLLIACLLVATREASEALISPEWALVSSDNAVLLKAAEFGLATAMVSEFLSLAKEWADDT